MSLRMSSLSCLHFHLKAPKHITQLPLSSGDRTLNLSSFLGLAQARKDCTCSLKDTLNKRVESVLVPFITGLIFSITLHPKIQAYCLGSCPEFPGSDGSFCFTQTQARPTWRYRRPRMLSRAARLGWPRDVSPLVSALAREGKLLLPKQMVVRHPLI